MYLFCDYSEHCLKYLMIRKLQKILHLYSLKCAEYWRKNPHQPLFFYSKMVKKVNFVASIKLCHMPLPGLVQPGFLSCQDYKRERWEAVGAAPGQVSSGSCGAAGTKHIFFSVFLKCANRVRKREQWDKTDVRTSLPCSRSSSSPFCSLFLIASLPPNIL